MIGTALIGATGVWGPCVATAVERGSALRLFTCYGGDDEKRRAFAADHDKDNWSLPTRLTPLRTGAGVQVGFERRDEIAEEFDEFAAAVRGEARPATGAEQGIAGLRVILEALR